MARVQSARGVTPGRGYAGPGRTEGSWSLGMILRIVRGRVADDDIDALRTAVTAAFDAAARAAPGLQRFHVAVRPDPEGGHELVVLTSWDSVDDALRAYDG